MGNAEWGLSAASNPHSTFRNPPSLTGVSVVIPSLAFTQRVGACLDALAAQSAPPLETWVVLARPGPGDPAPDRWPRTHVMRCPAPLSFCRAVNAGITASRAPWVLVLNDDVVVEPDFLERLLGGIPPDGRIGMACGRLLSADGLRLDSTGQFLSRARTATERGHGSSNRERFTRAGEVFSVPAAAALYRRTMLEALAVQGRYFDERLGMYLEDLDLGRRAQRAGWRAYYVPQASGRHIRGATAKTRPPRWPWLGRYYLPWLSQKLQARYICNRYQLIARYDTPATILANLPWIAWYEVRLWAYLLVFERHTIRLLRRSLSRLRKHSSLAQGSRLKAGGGSAMLDGKTVFPSSL